MTDKIYGSVDEITSGGATNVEYALVDGLKPGEKFRIGSVTAGDMIEWTEASEANDGEQKRTAGIRLITKSLVGPEPGNVRYADDPKYIPKIRVWRQKETQRIVEAILKLNGMKVRKDEKETTGEVAAKKD